MVYPPAHSVNHQWDQFFREMVGPVLLESSLHKRSGTVGTVTVRVPDGRCWLGGEYDCLAYGVVSA